MKGGNFLNKKERILDLYFNKHLKQIEIAEIVDASQQYISKIIKKDERYENEKSSRKSNNAEKRKIAQAEYQKNYVRKKEKDMEQLINKMAKMMLDENKDIVGKELAEKAKKKIDEENKGKGGKADEENTKSTTRRKKSTI